VEVPLFDFESRSYILFLKNEGLDRKSSIETAKKNKKREPLPSETL